MEPIDPNTATREQFTDHLINGPVPDDAATEWKDTCTNLKDILSKLAFHDAMKPNLQQTYMTPAASKNKVYFMWDFVGRTLGMLYNIRPSRPQSQKSAWADIQSRNAMASELLLDSKPGMLDMMVQSSYPNQSGPTPVIGDDIKEVARKLKP